MRRSLSWRTSLVSALLLALAAVLFSEPASAEERGAVMAAAARAAASYDYDRAIEMLNGISTGDDDEEVKAAIERYAAEKADCIPVKPSEVTHIFYHSLVVDPVRAFSDPDKRPGAIGHNQWMTTIDEFKKITQEMYDRGYVLISIRDIVEKTVDDKGRAHFKTKELLLPRGKKAFILSLDDLSYYHSYSPFGYASKMVLNKEGKPVCLYTDRSGASWLGAYDAVPILDRFIDAHPDAAYRGAKGIIALTGYNGILGYRTDETYDMKNINNKEINGDKRWWLKAHPDFDREAERAEAKRVADAMRAEGWEFASHSWGHIKAGEVSMSRLEADTKKWKENVAPLVGGSDILIFAHGADIGGPRKYNDKNERFKFFKKHGFDIFFNVNSHSHTLTIQDAFVHGGRRNLDGYRMYNNVYGKERNLADLFDARDVLDPSRPPVRPLK